MTARFSGLTAHWYRFAAALVVGLLIPSPANAGIFLITLSGTVTSEYDTPLIFGSQEEVDGKEFSAAYTLTYPSPNGGINENAFLRTYFGGTQFNIPTPLTAQFTLNGRTVSFAGGNSSSFTKFNDAPGTGDGLSASVYQTDTLPDGVSVIRTTWLTAAFQSDTQNLFDTLDYDEVVDLDLPAGGAATGRYLFAAEDDVGSRFATGALNITHLKVEVIEPLPEPATWAMMIVGFGLVGGSMRWSRNTVKAAYQRPR